MGMAKTAPDLFGRYLRLVRDLARRGDEGDADQSDLRQMLRWLDDDCRDLTVASRRQLRRELSMQIEQEALRYRDPGKRAVFIAVLKHLEAAE
jgi:hypothetical protein